MTTTPKKSDPLTHEELSEAADIFFPLFNEVHSRMPEGSTTEDTLKVMERKYQQLHLLLRE